MTDPGSTRIRIGGKTYSSLEELPPEMRQKLEQAVRQMRDSGLLDDKNRDGIPDRFETPLRVAGWFGRLTGNPRLKARLQQQLQAFNVTAVSGTPPARPSAGTPTSGSAVQTRERGMARTPPQSAVQRRDNDPHGDTGLREFMRKLAIVSAVVIVGYVLLRLLGMA